MIIRQGMILLIGRKHDSMTCNYDSITTNEVGDPTAVRGGRGGGLLPYLNVIITSNVSR